MASVRSDTLTSIGLLVLRLTGVLMLVGHGWGKLTSFSTNASTFGDPIGLGPELSMGLATFAEFFCAAGIAVGLLTRLAAIPLVINMAVAAFVVHAADPFAKKEFALLYLIPFLTLLFTGPGRFSLDALIFKRKRV